MREREKSPAKVLIVDDESMIRETLVEFLAAEGYEAIACATGEAALERAAAAKFDVVLCDINLPGCDGLDVLEGLQTSSPDSQVMLITAFASVETAIAAFQKGAFDYLIKPISLADLAVKLHRLLTYRELHRENQRLRIELSRSDEPAEWFDFKNEAMRQVWQRAIALAATRSTVLLLGESGIGKDAFARAIHRLGASERAGKFVPIDCASLAADAVDRLLFGSQSDPGLLAMTGTGSVLLDDIGALPLDVQAKLLRTIERGDVLPAGAKTSVPIAARLLAATNRDLDAEVAAGRFRSDLYYRLGAASLVVPPLRERPEDMPGLLAFLLAKHSRETGKPFTSFAPECLPILRTYHWPGNVRELDSAIRRAVLLGDPPLIRAEHLPANLRPSRPVETDDLHDAAERFERQHIARVLKETPDKRRAAKRLGIGLSSLYRKIDEHGLAEE